MSTPNFDTIQLPSLEEYVLISSMQISVEVYRRASGRFWLYTAYQLEDSITLESVGYEFPVALLYEDTIMTLPSSS